MLTSDLPCSLTLNGEPLATLPAKEIRRVTVAAGQHLLVATSSDGRLRWQKVVDAKPGQQVVQIELATAGAVFSTDDFDRSMAGVSARDGGREDGGRVRDLDPRPLVGLPQPQPEHGAAHGAPVPEAADRGAFEDGALGSRAQAHVGGRAADHAGRRQVHRAHDEVGRRRAKANSWQGEPANLFAQARALEPGIAFPPDALGTLRASKAFVEALPPTAAPSWACRATRATSTWAPATTRARPR